MEISFFEEFPTSSNLAKLKYVSWDCKLYLAANSVSEFLKLEKQVMKKYPHVVECVYWPTLSILDGYWISPWSDTVALEQLFNSLLLEQERRVKKGEKSLSVMLDFEPPKLKRQIFKRFFSFSKNRKLIMEFLLSAKKIGINVYNIEMSHLPESIVWMLGLGYSARAFGHKNIAMYYRSMAQRFIGSFIAKKRFASKVRKFVKRDMLIGVGLIAPGIHEVEPCYGDKGLEEDLQICFDAGCSETIVFRLGGMDAGFEEVCLKFV
jgi:hypothetical protein